MISYTTGNLFDSHAQALVNTVNTQGVMGKGIALQFKERYPNNYKSYRQACKDQKVVIGKMFITEEREMDGNKRLIINFPTKQHWRNSSQYSYISSGLQDLRQEIIDRDIASIAIPALGSCNGGLDWNNVKRMIEEYLHDLDCQIMIYEPNALIIDRMKKEKAKLTPARAMLLSVLCDMVLEDGTPSEFAAEKIAFFLQEFGAKDAFRLQFQKGYYGPYSGKVKFVLHYLNGSYIMGMETMNNKPFDEFWVTGDAANVVSEYLHKKENQRWLSIAERTKEFLRGFYSNYMLELLATIAYLSKTDKTLLNAKTEEEKIETIGRDLAQWSNRKDKMFHEDKYIGMALQHLVDK